MKKATWRFNRSEIAAAVAATTSLRAAARRLGCNVSTVSRAVASGKAAAAVRGPRQRPQAAPASSSPASGAEPGSFAAWCRGTFDLTRAEAEIVDLAQAALDMAHDPAASPPVRLQAMTQYRACLRDLKLPTEDNHGDAETRYPRRA